MRNSDKNQLMFSLLQCSLFGKLAVSEIETFEGAVETAVSKKCRQIP